MIRIGKWESIMEFPHPDDVIFIDIETDLDTNQIWLIGVRLQNNIEQFIAHNYSEERKILTEFGSFLENNPNVPLVCYSMTNFDFRIICARIKELQLHEVMSAMKRRPWIDFGTLLRRHFKPFSKSYSLKVLRYLVDFQYNDPEMTGEEMAIQYYLQTKKHGQITDDFKEKALKYNKDDIDILKHLLNIFEENIEFHSDYSNHETSIDSKELKRLIDQAYSYRLTDNYFRISVYKSQEIKYQRNLMKFGLPLPQKSQGKKVTALYWRSKLAIERCNEILKDLI